MKKFVNETGRTTQRGAALCLWPLACVLAGCAARGPETAPVHGTVTIDGKPLATGTVLFIPETNAPYASGKLDANGKYVLTTTTPGDGAVLGRHRILVNAVDGSNPDVPPVPLIPFHYASEQSSGLSAVVAAGQENTVDLSLESKRSRK